MYEKLRALRAFEKQHLDFLGTVEDRHLIAEVGYHQAKRKLLKRAAQEAKQAGRALCLAADMSWTLSRNLRIDSILDVETRLDALARQLPLKALCVYDARHFSSGDFLHAVKCHRDHSRYPIVLG